MTKLYVNDNEIDFDSDDRSVTFGQCLEAIESQLGPGGNIIVGLFLDGLEEHDWRRSDLIARPLSTINEVRLSVASLVDVVKLGIDSCCEFTGEIYKGVEDSLSAIQDEDFEATFSGVSTIFNLLSDLVETTNLLNVTATKAGLDISYQGQVERYSMLISNIDRINKARDAGDFVLVADILEYEALPLVKELDSLLSSLSTAGRG